MNGLDCQSCTEQLRQVRGHYGFSERFIAGVKVNKCPLLYAEPIDLLWLEGYRHYKAGFLPDVGGWLDQNNKFIEAIMHIDALVEEMTEEKNRGDK